MNSLIETIKKEIGKVIIGQEKMIDALLVGLMCDGHILLEGVPGLAKTTTVKTLSQTLGLLFKRIQFTPDLLPSDIIGAEIYDPKNNIFAIKKGPIFTNLLLADEINRAPAKVQSALLEVMQERQVTIGDESFKIPLPFLVLATQNPVEQEGAYTLPEAQLDRFMLKIVVGYNTKDEELDIAKRVCAKEHTTPQKIIDKEELSKIKEELFGIHIDKEVEKYIIDIIFATREPSSYGLKSLSHLIRFGASPRASIDLFKASKATAYLRGKDFVSPVDIAYIATSVLRHRIMLSYEAEADGISSDEIVAKVLDGVPIP